MVAVEKTEVPCPECKKEFSIVIDNYQIEKYITPHGMCESCFIKSKDLVKVNNHYVPRDYVYWSYEGVSRLEEEYDDINAVFPTVVWDDYFKKWKVTFDSADFDGVGVMSFTWYFDTKEDILKEMGLLEE